MSNPTWASITGVSLFQNTTINNGFLYGGAISLPNNINIYRININDPNNDNTPQFAIINLTSGGSSPPIVSGSATDGIFLYVLSISNYGSGTPQINKIELSNSDTNTNCTPFTFTYSSNNIKGLTIDDSGTYLFTTVNDSGTIKLIKIPISNPNVITDICVINQQSNTILFNNDCVYIYNQTTNSIDKVEISSSTYTASWVTLPETPSTNFITGIAITYNNLYISICDFGGSTLNIYSINYATAVYSLILTSSDLNNSQLVSSLSCDLYYLYITNYTTINGGNPFNSNGNIFRYTIPIPQPPCFHEDSKILTDRGYIAIKELRRGDLVQTLRNGLVPIYAVGYRNMTNISSIERTKSQLYICHPSNYPELTEPLILTGCHSLLTNKYVPDEIKDKIIQTHGQLFVTDNRLRVPACCDPRADIYGIDGDYTIYHIALENNDYFMNYGIYVNGGLVVETCSLRYIRELSGMMLR